MTGDSRNERLKLRAHFVSSIGVGLLVLAMVLPILPTGVSLWTLGAVMALLTVAGFACIGGAIWYLGRLRP